MLMESRRLSRQSRGSITTRRKMASLRVSLQRRQSRLRERVGADRFRRSAFEQVDLHTTEHHTSQMFPTAVSSEVGSKLT